MAKTIVNLAHRVIIRTAEDVLETYPSHPHQQAFANPDLRQKLIAYVLSRVPGAYVAVDELCEAPVNSESFCCSMDQRHQIEALIHQGIEKILRDNWSWAERHIPEKTSASFAPSNWFG
jgi:hypothetical protein